MLSQGSGHRQRDREEEAPEAPPSDPKPNDVDAANAGGNTRGRGSDGSAGEQHGNAGARRKAKKATLEDLIKDMKSEKDKLKHQKKEVAKQLKAANRKRRRLKKRASALSQDDLFELCRMRDLNPEMMEESDEDRRRDE